MQSSGWLSYLGAITGVTGAVMGYVAFRRSGKFKALDLRLELRKALDTLQADSEELVPLLERAKHSRTRVAAASGALGSGATKHWLATWDQDLAITRAQESEVLALQKDCSKYSHASLESELVSAHRLQRKINTMKDKYRRSLAQDDEQRDWLRQNQRGES